jgi:serine/threonine-protein kinase
MARHLQTSPIPPSERTELAIPREVDDVILSCLEKDPARRPQSANRLDALLAACGSERPWTPDRAREWWTLHQPTVAATQATGGERIQLI